MTELETLRRCMELMPSSVCEYNEWLHVGMVLYDLLGEAGCPEWENWSMSDSRYHEGECFSKMRGFGRNHDKVTVGTIVKYVKDHGLWEDGPRQSHGNFLWGLYITGYILYLYVYAMFIRNVREYRSGGAARTKGARVYLIAGFILMVLHIASGLYYFRGIIMGEYIY